MSNLSHFDQRDRIMEILDELVATCESCGSTTEEFGRCSIDISHSQLIEFAEQIMEVGKV